MYEDTYVSLRDDTTPSEATDSPIVAGSTAATSSSTTTDTDANNDHGVPKSGFFLPDA